MNEPIERRWLEALRRDREAAVPDEAQARVASRLALAPRGHSPSHDGSHTGLGSGGSLARGLLAVTFFTGAAVGALLHAVLARPPAPHVLYVDRPAPAVSSAVPASMSRMPPEASNSAPAVASSSAPSTTPLARAGVAQLDAERALLDAARVALVSGDSDTSLRALQQHSKAFAHPMLGEERDALFVQALVRAGRYDEARGRAEVFRRRDPQSLFLPAVDAAIASIP